MFSINEYLKCSNNIQAGSIGLRNPVVCNDGFSISIQASQHHYCEPRIDNADRYTSVECGFPSDTDCAILFEYAEDNANLTDTVYAYVPVEKVDELINYHNRQSPITY